MFQDKVQRERRPRKWAKAAGDHATLSAAGNRETGKYIADLDLEMTENIRFKPAQPEGDQRLRSVRPSSCAAREELPRLSGEMDLTTGRAEVGYDERKRDMVFSFVRHENDSEGREVQENRARVRTIHGLDRFRSNDEEFAQGAMAMRCEAARSPKAVMRRFGTMSAREGGDTTMDRVLPFQRADQERARVKQLRQLEHDSRTERSQIHSAASGVAAFAQRKQQKQMEFRKKFAKAVNRARESRPAEDYQLYIRKKREAMEEELLQEGVPLGAEPGWRPEADIQREQAPEFPAREDTDPRHSNSIL